MRIHGFNGTNPQTGAMGMTQAKDAVSKNIQNQIANAQQQLQDLSSKEEMSLEDKMKERQEIQKEIANLNQQLRQHQMEQRREQQSKNFTSTEDGTAGAKSTSAKNTSGKKGAGLTQVSMQAMISADASMKQAKVQGNIATRMKGRAGVLAAEIKQDAGSGNTEKKEAELADLQEKAQAATEAQLSTLAKANKTMEKAAQADTRTENTKTKKDNTEKTDTVEKADTKIDTKTDTIERTDAKEQPQPAATVEAPASEAGQTGIRQTVYTPIDVRL